MIKNENSRAWAFVEDNYPDYYSSDQILRANDLNILLESKDIDYEEHLELIELERHIYLQSILAYQEKLEHRGSILPKIGQFKLGRSLIKGSHIVSNKILQQNNVKEQIIKHMAIKLAHEILTRLDLEPESTNQIDEVKFSYNIIFTKLVDFKLIVNTAIQMLSYDQIKDIKNGNLLYNKIT